MQPGVGGWIRKQHRGCVVLSVCLPVHLSFYHDKVLTTSVPTMYPGGEILRPTEGTEHVSTHQAKHLALQLWGETDGAAVPLGSGECECVCVSVLVRVCECWGGEKHCAWFNWQCQGCHVHISTLCRH